MKIASTIILTFFLAVILKAQDYPLKGLEKPVEIIVDSWGIPHIYAKTEKDLFFARIRSITCWIAVGDGSFKSAHFLGYYLSSETLKVPTRFFIPRSIFFDLLGPIGPSSVGPSFCHFLVPILGFGLVSFRISAPEETVQPTAWQEFKLRLYQVDKMTDTMDAVPE